MKPYEPKHHGLADYNKYVGIADASVPVLATGSPSNDYFAQMVHVVNPGDISNGTSIIYTMITKQLSASDTPVQLSTLMESAGASFAGDYFASGVVLQIDPLETNTVDVMSAGETAGFTLSNATTGVNNIAFNIGSATEVYLKGSIALVKVKVLLER